MIISREMDYALRILRQLSRGGSMQAAELEKSENVSVNFARKILQKLKRAGIVQITRGPEGGCSLAIPCQKLTLWDVKQAIDPEPVMNRCMQLDYRCDGSCGDSCGIRNECRRIEILLQEEMQRRSLCDLYRERP